MFVGRAIGIMTSLLKKLKELESSKKICYNTIEIDEKGKIDLTKFKPICYDCDTHGYYTLGERVGTAFLDGLKLK